MEIILSDYTDNSVDDYILPALAKVDITAEALLKYKHINESKNLQHPSQIMLLK